AAARPARAGRHGIPRPPPSASRRGSTGTAYPAIDSRRSLPSGGVLPGGGPAQSAEHGLPPRRARGDAELGLDTAPPGLAHAPAQVGVAGQAPHRLDPFAGRPGEEAGFAVPDQVGLDAD